MSDETEHRESPPPEPSEAAKKVAASLVKRSLAKEPAEYKSLVSDPSAVLPMDAGDPLPDGIRPGPGTGHTPSDEAETTRPPSSADSSE
jgi:hypothetical protein